MKLTRVALSWLVIASLAGSVLVAAHPTSALEPSDPSSQQNQANAEDEPEEDIVLLDDGAFTDEPRLGAENLPTSGPKVDSQSASIAALLTASATYLTLAIRSHRLGNK